MSSILIVDDEEDVVTFLTTVLEEEGFKVRGATGALEALLQLQKEKPQVILLDLMMPKVTGEELCRIIKNDPNLFDIRIIMLSARTDVESKVKCFNSGADEYLVKPIETRELVARMKSFFRLLGGIRPVSRSGELKASATVDIYPEASGPRIRPQYGNYRVESLVGSGGMGNVFKGYDSLLDRPVALKVLSRALSNSPRFVERFRQEAKILASTEHPGIAAIYAFGEEQGDHYFAMQWCPGGSVMDLLQKKQRIELLTVIDIALQCVDALSAAFNKGIVHRDVKPSNLMFDQNQRIKIVDFGLAKAERLASSISQASELFGTPDYMAPEQAQFGVVDHRADIYSLGTTLYLMLYGKLPYDARTPIEMVVKHASEPFPEYNSMDGAVPREAYEIIERMTRKSPEARYQDYPSCRRDLIRLRDEIYSSTGVLLPRLQNVAAVPVFKNTNFTELLSTLHHSPMTGLLTASSGAVSLRFLVQNKQILFFESPNIEEKIWQLLAENQLIKKEEVPQPGSDFQECLMRLLMRQSFGLEDLSKIHRQYLRSLLLDIGLWKHFEGEFFEGTVIHDDIGGIFIGDVLLGLARDIIPFDELETLVDSKQAIARTADFEQTLPELSLTPEESFLVSRLDESQSLNVESLCMMTGFSEEKVKRFIFVLLKLRACRFKSSTEKPTRPIRPSDEEELSAEHYGRIAEQFYELGKKELDQGHYWKVTELCKQAIHNDSNRGKYYHLMALAFSHHPRFIADAEQCFRKSIDLDPEEIEFRISFVRFLLQQGFVDNALEECNLALDVDPENEEARTLRDMLTEKP